MNRFKACVAVGLLLLAGCGGEGGTAGPGSDLDSGAAQGNSSPGTPTPGEKAATGTPIDLDLTAPAVLGDDVDLSDFAGQDLALWFWAPW